MLMPKKDRTMILAYLFKEGVLVAKKDTIDKHMVLPVKNLYVLKLMQSLTSRGYVKNSFNWNYNYYFLTDSGIDFLRGYLNLPENIVPSTLTFQKKYSEEPRDRSRFNRGDRSGEQQEQQDQEGKGRSNYYTSNRGESGRESGRGVVRTE